MHLTDPTTPSSVFINLITPLPRRAASIITQIKQQDPDSIEHFILHCPALIKFIAETGRLNRQLPSYPTKPQLDTPDQTVT